MRREAESEARAREAATAAAVARARADEVLREKARQKRAAEAEAAARRSPMEIKKWARKSWLQAPVRLQVKVGPGGRIVHCAVTVAPLPGMAAGGSGAGMDGTEDGWLSQGSDELGLSGDERRGGFDLQNPWGPLGLTGWGSWACPTIRANPHSC